MPHQNNPPSAEFEREIRQLYRERNSRGFDTPADKRPSFRVDFVALMLFAIIVSSATSVIAVSLLQPMLSSLPPVERSVRRPAEPATASGIKEEALNRLAGSVVSIFASRPAKSGTLESVYLAEESLGQGLVLSSDGWLVTTQAVVADDRRSYAVATADGEVHEVEQVVPDPVAPFMFLKVAARNLSATAFAAPENLVVGQSLIVPALDTQSITRSFYQASLANASARFASTRAELPASSESLPDRYLLDRAMPGSLLGAPVATQQGEVIGLLATYGDETRSVVPLDSLANTIDYLFTSQQVHRPVLGVTYVQNSWLGPFAGAGQASDGATLVASARRSAVVAKGPAASAGLKEGDTIIAVAGERLAARSLSSVIQQYRPGAELELEIVRAGKNSIISVTLGEDIAGP